MKSIRKHRRKKPRQTNKNRVNRINKVKGIKGIKGRGIMQSNPLIGEKEAFDNFLIN